MADRPNPPHGPIRAEGRPVPPIGPLAAAHDRHDALLVAAYAANDLDGAPKAEAADLVAGCSACAALAADLRALATAAAALPPVARPRDFKLTPADGARLRPAGWRRFLRAIAGPGALARPLAASLTTLGVAGLLLAALPGIMPLAGSAASAPSTLERVDASAAPPSDGGPQGEFDAQGEMPPGPGDPAGPGAGALVEPKSSPSGDHAPEPTSASEPSWLAIGSGVLLAAGVAFFVLIRVAERDGRGTSGT